MSELSNVSETKKILNRKIRLREEGHEIEKHAVKDTSVASWGSLSGKTCLSKQQK